MITAQQQEFFSTSQFESSGIWRSTAGETRGLVARLRGILAGQEKVTLEFGADDAWRLSVGGVVFSDRRFLAGYRPLACIRAIEPGLALGILSRGRVRLRDSLAAVNCGQSSFLLPAFKPSASCPTPDQSFCCRRLKLDRPGAGRCRVLSGPARRTICSGWALAGRHGRISAELAIPRDNRRRAFCTGLFGLDPTPSTHSPRPGCGCMANT